MNQLAATSGVAARAEDGLQSGPPYQGAAQCSPSHAASPACECCKTLQSRLHARTCEDLPVPLGEPTIHAGHMGTLTACDRLRRACRSAWPAWETFWRFSAASRAAMALAPTPRAPSCWAPPAVSSPPAWCVYTRLHLLQSYLSSLWQCCDSCAAWCSIAVHHSLQGSPSKICEQGPANG